MLADTVGVPDNEVVEAKSTNCRQSRFQNTSQAVDRNNTSDAGSRAGLFDGDVREK